MEGIRLLMATALVAVPVGLAAQSNSETIERALAAAPPSAREGATVIRWNADYTYQTLKEGTNGLVCYDRSDEPRRPAFAVQCTVIGNLDRVAQNRKFRAEAADAAAERAMVAEAEANGTRVMQEYGSLWIMMNGEDQASARTHLTIGVPGATSESTGLPTTRSMTHAWLMDAGSSAAHIMIPGR